MSERDDYRLGDEERGDDLELGHRPAVGEETRSGGRRMWPWLLVLLVAVAAAGWWLLFRPDAEEPAPPPAVERLEAPGREPVEEADEDLGPLPPLDASDRFVAEAVRRLTAHPELARHLATEGLVRRFVAAVDNVARGVSPRPNLPELIPGGGYRVSDAGGTLLPEAESYRRYDTATEIFVSIDTAGAARLYRHLRPLLAEAYRDLGYPDAEFDDTLRAAIDHLLATPVPPPAPELVPAGVAGYAYADPDLEALSAAQKHLLRTGPRNLRRIQEKLRELSAALGV